jgi:hypothetical protein
LWVFCGQKTQEEKERQETTDAHQFFYPARDSKMPEIGANRCHCEMQFTGFHPFQSLQYWTKRYILDRYNIFSAGVVQKSPVISAANHLYNNAIDQCAETRYICSAQINPLARKFWTLDHSWDQLWSAVWPSSREHPKIYGKTRG